ncbi:MAG: hypothetical protein WHS90_11260 [Caldilinea sp.]|uniref:hypothetical protein n=1 Tax=Caldilinea sp. TaxID=2293560 RepID=UPI0030B10050
MPRPLLDSPYIFGLHDPGGEWIMAQAGRRGWILFTEAVGSDPNDRSGADYRPYSEQDFGVIVRINNGYGAVGTIPTPEQYASFARRVANFVAASPGCHIWIIGNETNHPQEWPVDHRGPRPILPEDYVRCFRLCREAIRSLPGHGDDLVVIGAVAPWNAQLTYPANPTGDWVLYFRHILEGLGAEGLDGIALHTYTHGPDPALILDRSTMNPPFQHRFFNFQAYRNFMDAIPSTMRSLPVFITETNQDAPWLDANNGWVQAAYAEIDRWNRQPGAQQIRCLLLYRWQRYDQWHIDGKNGVIADFRAALANDYRWKEPPPKPARYQVGDVVRTLAAINLRAAPSGQILGVLPPGTQATIRSAPHAMSGGLPLLGGARPLQRSAAQRLAGSIHAGWPAPADAGDVRQPAACVLQSGRQGAHAGGDQLPQPARRPGARTAPAQHRADRPRSHFCDGDRRAVVVGARGTERRARGWLGGAIYAGRRQFARASPAGRPAGGCVGKRHCGADLCAGGGGAHAHAGADATHAGRDQQARRRHNCAGSRRRNFDAAGGAAPRR